MHPDGVVVTAKANRWPAVIVTEITPESSNATPFVSVNDCNVEGVVSSRKATTPATVHPAGTVELKAVKRIKVCADAKTTNGQKGCGSDVPNGLI